VKVVRNTIIGFRKLEYVSIVREVGNFVQKRICDATLDEYKLQMTNEDYVKEMKKIMGKDDDEASGSSEAEDVAVGPKDAAEPAGSSAPSEASGSKERKI
jgi:hypothetical protein